MILQLNPPLMVYTPKGKAVAHLVIDYGMEVDLYWVCFLHENGQCWTYSNKEITIESNITIGRDLKRNRMPDRDEMITMLSNDICEVVFEKVDGTERIMFCTRNFDLIPKSNHLTLKESGIEPNPDVLRVYDMEKNDWRSFRVESVSKFNLIGDRI